MYIAARSEEKANKVIVSIEQEHADSHGRLKFLKLDLGDLTTIRASADEFLKAETRLDVLWNNAGVMIPEAGSKTTQGYELQLGTNNIGHFLFTHFLHPILAETAKKSPPGSVRVVWVASSIVEAAPRPAIDFSNMSYQREEGKWAMYGRSKAGNVLHACEFARRTKDEGIISLVSSPPPPPDPTARSTSSLTISQSLNPGNCLTDLQKTMPGWQVALLVCHGVPPECKARWQRLRSCTRNLSRMTPSLEPTPNFLQGSNQTLQLAAGAST